MMKNFLRSTFAISALLLAATGAQAANIYVEEEPKMLRLEQYGGSSAIVMWRMPTPGVSTFPSGTCLKLTIPAEQVTQGSRFLALYLYAKSNSVNIFYFYNPDTCTIASFGING